MRTELPLLALFVSAACQPPGVAVPVERLEVPAEVVIPDAVAGAPTLHLFEIGNVGAGAARVGLRVGNPFYVTTPSVYVPAGGTVAVRLGVRGPGYDTVTGTLEVVGPFDRASIPVSAVFDRDLDDDGVEAIAAGGDDCDDDDPDAWPGADEVCNGRDDDCDEAVDEDAVDARTWYRDADGDGFGALESLRTCSRPSGFAASGGDCDDAAMDVHPGAREAFYDGVDQDCSGGSDYDRDDDGYDHALFGGADCRDDDEDIHPDAPEADDLADQDCDTLVDEDFLEHGALVITEVLVAPAVRDASAGQYVEIVNPSSTRTLQLRGMAVESSAGTVILGPALLAPKAVGLLCASTKPSVNGGLTCLGPLPGLLDAHDWITVTSAVVLDEVDWTGEDWKMLPGQSIELTEIDADANDDATAWCAATASADPTPVDDAGTPGDATASCAP